MKASLTLSFLISFLLICLLQNQVNSQDFLKKYLNSSLLKDGKQYMSDGDYPSAITEFTKSIKKDPDNLVAYYQLGRIFEEIMYDYDKAISLYEKVIILSEGGKQTGNDEVPKEFNTLITNTKTSIDRAIKKKYKAIEKPRIPVYIIVKPYKEILDEPKRSSSSKYKTASYSSEFMFLSFSANWYQIDISSIGSGWINGNDVLKITQKKKKAVETSPAGKIALYEKFVDQYPDSLFAQTAKDKADDIDYRLASEEGSVNSYSMYLRKYPDSKHAKVARSKLDTLTFAQAKYDNNTVSLEGYIIDFPDGKFVSEAKQILEGIRYNQAESIDTVVSYRKYLDEYADGRFVLQAQKRIEELAFEDAKTEDTINAYKKFTTEYPDSYLAVTANNMIETGYFENARLKGTIKAYKEYVELYPDGLHLGEAQLIIDKYTFKPYKQRGSVGDLEKFIKKYPENRFVNDARQKIILLQTANTGKEPDSGFPYLLTIIIFSGVGIVIAGVLMRKRVVSMVQTWQQGDWSCECGAKHKKDVENCPVCENTRSKLYAMYGELPEKEIIEQETKVIQAKAINTIGEMREYYDKLEKDRKDKYEVWRQSVEVETDKENSPTAALQLKTGTILVESEPANAGIYIDGKEAGKTPGSLKSVVPGTHEVEVRIDGYESWSESIDVEADKE